MIKWVFILAVFFSTCVFSQHLPLKIGNQWHYDMTIMPPGIDYVAIAVDTVSINNMTYFKFKRINAYTGELLETTYDRLDGDSAYYRNYNGEDSLIVNFNWAEGFTRVTTSDSICFYFNRLIYINQRNIWDFITDAYHFNGGFWCAGMQDTAWVLFISEITRELGCYNDADGWLQGAIIDGKAYGSLYPVSIEAEDLLEDFSLYQNFPNPFNPTTKINYSVPQSSNVLLKVFDVLGNEVATLVNEEKSAGTYEVEFDGSGLTSGIYFYQLKASNYVETKKMMLLK